MALAALLVALPWLPIRPAEQAVWLPREQWPVNVVVLLAGALVLILTVVGLFFRGVSWRLVSPF